MIIDSSALVAIVFDEPSAAAMLAAIISSEACAIAAPTLLETSIVLDSRRKPAASRMFDLLLADAAIEIVPFTASQSRVAREAYRDFGRGSGHPANLNFGDCFSYALAAERREALLYVGDDFGHTDIRSALDVPQD